MLAIAMLGRINVTDVIKHPDDGAVCVVLHGNNNGLSLFCIEAQWTYVMTVNDMTSAKRTTEGRTDSVREVAELMWNLVRL